MEAVTNEQVPQILDDLYKDFKDKMVELTNKYVVGGKVNPVNVYSAKRFFDSMLKDYNYKLQKI